MGSCNAMRRTQGDVVAGVSGPTDKLTEGIALKDDTSAVDRHDPLPAQPTHGDFSAGYVRYAIALLAVVNVLNYMDRVAISVLLPYIKVDLQLTDSQLGLLVGFAFFLFYATCGIPIARWADRGIRKNIIALVIAVWSAMMALAGAAQNFWQLVAARVGLGIGEAGATPASSSMIADYVPIERRSGVFSAYGTGSVIGTMLGLALAGALADVLGWRWCFVALGAPGLLLAVVVWYTLREPQRGRYDVIKDQHTNPSLGITLGSLWRCMTYRTLATYYVINGFAHAGLMQWYPSFCMREFGLSSSTVGFTMGIAVGVGAAVGLLIGGVLANKPLQDNARSMFSISAVAILISLPTTLAMLFAPSFSMSVFFAAVTSLLWYMPHGAAASSMYSVIQPNMRATASAVTIFCISVLGFGLGPFCVGVLSDYLSPSYASESLRYAMLLPAALLPLTGLILHSVGKYVLDDLEAVGVGFGRESRSQDPAFASDAPAAQSTR